MGARVSVPPRSFMGVGEGSWNRPFYVRMGRLVSGRDKGWQVAKRSETELARVSWHNPVDKNWTLTSIFIVQSTRPFPIYCFINQTTTNGIGMDIFDGLPQGGFTCYISIISSACLPKSKDSFSIRSGDGQLFEPLPVILFKPIFRPS